MDITLSQELDPSSLYSVFHAIQLEGGLITMADIPTLISQITSKHVLHSVSEYEAIIQQCLDKHWLKTLTEADCRADHERWNAQRDQTWCDFIDYKINGVDFTDTGWLLYTKLAEERKGENWHNKFIQSVHYLQRSHTHLSIISGSKKMLLQALQNTRSCSEKVVDQTLGPYFIDTWWVNRFYLLPQTYRVDILFKS